MPSCSEIITASRFKPRLPGGRHDLVFKVVFGSDAAAARFFGVSKMTIWRWRHDRTPLPKWVTDVLPDLIQRTVEKAHLLKRYSGISSLSRPSQPGRFRAVALGAIAG